MSELTKAEVERIMTGGLWRVGQADALCRDWLELKGVEDELLTAQGDIDLLKQDLAKTIGERDHARADLARLQRELAEERERLDYLESLKTEVMFWQPNGNGKVSFCPSDDPKSLIEADTLRDAIDAALRAAKEEHG